MPTVDLLRAIQLSPDLLDRISPREFEQLVAEILASLGWQVSLTSAMSDGGRDILAIARTGGGIELRTIVECKRYRPDRVVGIEVVREILGVKYDVGAAKALLVTTSHFSRPAQQLANERQWELELVDRDRLIEWIRGYSPAPTEQPHLREQQFASCFLSHSHKDHDFASYLNTRLKEAKVKVWFAPDDLKPGEKTKRQIDRAIAAFDRVVAVLSKYAVSSSWVHTELTAALRLERQSTRDVLFPVSLMSYTELLKWECFNSDLGVDIAAAIREYPILDFSNWRNSETFESQFAKLLVGLSRVPPA